MKVLLIILSIFTFSNAEYTWKKKTYSMEKYLDKLDKQSEEKADWILKEVNKNQNNADINTTKRDINGK